MPTPAIAHQYIERTSTQLPCLLTLKIEENDCLTVAQSVIQITNQPVCVLNMANQIYVGGDYLTGQGKEESLIQRTNLLESLIQLEGVKPGIISNPHKYQLANCLGFNETSRTGFGEFTCLYSSDITVNYINNGHPLDAQSFTINVISSSAYNLSNDDSSIERGLYIAGTVFKILNQLRTAKNHGQRHLVLGAFGCGAFKNDPQFIAELYHSAIYEFEFQGSFDSIYFAIKPTYSGQINSNYSAFCQEFSRSPKPLYDLIEEVFPLRKNNPTLNSMLLPFDIIESAQELLFLASRLINCELQNLSHFSQKNDSKIEFYTYLLKLLETKPNHVREILASALVSPVCQVSTSTAGFFKGIKCSFINKLEALLNRIPPTIPGLIPVQTTLAEESVQNYILSRAKELIECCKDENDKRVSCFMLYIAALKDKETLLKELEHRYIAPKYQAVHDLLIAINALCLGQSQHIIYSSIADPRFFSGTSEEHAGWTKQIAKSLGNYISLSLETFLEISYPDYFRQDFFEQIIKQNFQNQDYSENRELIVLNLT
jgi:uncharacterized protein (TIGR02452 family)